MQKLVVIWGLLLGSVVAGRAQGFLADYQRYLRQSTQASQADREREISLLREILAAHRQKTGRDLAAADTLTLITLQSVEVAGYAPDGGIIWNRTDTVCFRRQYQHGRPVVSYEPFLEPALDDYDDIGPDSLVALVARRQFARAQQLAREHPVHDGRRSRVVAAVRTPAGYRITAFTLPAFGLLRFERRRK
ncbi:hypothetical protein [Hymenobacter gummosus]|uniref:hypothetical protein n=1 Tax=Hymenobacter gummosus TaxID=1776032 RepID=UPI0014049550|nr:hypothetical protein [Hymenobacter gummosus]